MPDILPFQELCDTELSSHPEPLRRAAGLFIQTVVGNAVYTRSDVAAPRETLDKIQELVSSASELTECYRLLHTDARRRPGVNTTWISRVSAFVNSPCFPRLRALLADPIAPYEAMFTRGASGDITRTLVLELRSLLNRGAVLTAEKVTLDISPCILKNQSDPRSPEINFGAFKITLKAADVAGFRSVSDHSPEGYFKVTALTPHPRTGPDGNPHPHVSPSGAMCLGDGRHRVSQLLKAGLIDEAFIVIDTVLRNYGSHPFRRIETYYEPNQAPVRCVDCGASCHIDDEDVTPCLDGGYLCPNCGFEDTIRDGTSAGRPFTCMVCEGVTHLRFRVIVEGGDEMCERCATAGGHNIVSRAPPATPQPTPARPIVPPTPPTPPPPAVFTCPTCGNTGATRNLTDTLLGRPCCENCSTTIGGYVVSKPVFETTTAFVAWMLMYMQNALGADRACHFSIELQSFTPASRLTAIRNLCASQARTYFQNLANSRGEQAMLTSIVSRANNFMGSRIINVTQEACDYHDTLMVERILTPI